MTRSVKLTLTMSMVCLILFGSCSIFSKPQNRIAFYTLEYDPPKVTDLKPLPVVIKLKRFTVAPVYNTDRIIYRDQSFKRNAYVYHKWRANPGDLVAQFLGRDLRLSGLFKAVLSHDTGFDTIYEMEGSVDEFVEWDTDETWKAALSLSITVMVENEPDVTKKIIFQKSYHVKESCSRKHPRALAEAMSRAMAMVSKEIIMDVYDHMKE